MLIGSYNQLLIAASRSPVTPGRPNEGAARIAIRAPIKWILPSVTSITVAAPALNGSFEVVPAGVSEDSTFLNVSKRRHQAVREKLTVYHSFAGRPPGWNSRRHQCLPMSSERSLHAARGRLTIYHCFLASSAGWISEDINVYQCFRADSDSSDHHKGSHTPALLSAASAFPRCAL